MGHLYSQRGAVSSKDGVAASCRHNYSDHCYLRQQMDDTAAPGSHNRGIPLASATWVHELDRFTITHTIRDGDTIWGMAVRYYGSGSLVDQQQLRVANPWFPEDPRQLRIGLQVKIPVR